MTMGQTKCKNIITNVLYPVERDRVVNSIQNTKFSIFIDETSDICNVKWMMFLVRYVDPETLDIRTQLVKLIDIDARNSSAEQLFSAFKNEMWELQIPFLNIIALSCDNASVMIGKHQSFKKKLEEFCKNLLTFSCPCHSAALVAHAACGKISEYCDEFLYDNDRKTLFNDISFVAQTLGGFDENELQQEWYSLHLDFTIEEKEQLSKLNFDEMWKKIVRNKYPNLKSLVNAVRSLPHSNADPERMFSLLTDLKTKKRNKLSNACVNATCTFKSALKARGETILDMDINEKHLSLMSTNNLYFYSPKKRAP